MIEILDRITLGRVLAASPVVDEGNIARAYRVVVALKNLPGEVEVINGTCHMAQVGEVAERAGLGAKQTGLLLRALGLTIGPRTRAGYAVYWTDEQVEIITSGLEVA